MVVITCTVAADKGPKQYLEDVSATWWELQKEDLDTDVILVSGQHQARVHREILLRISPFLHGLVPSSCPCSTPAITLQKVQGDTLEALVELAYTGRSKVGSKKAKEEFKELTEFLKIGLEVQYEEIIFRERENPVIRANEVAEGVTAKRTPHSLEMIKLADKASSAKVDGPRQSRGRKSTVKEGQIIPLLSPITLDRKANSPDSILAKTTRYQKRKIQTILDVNDEIHANPDPKKRKIDVCFDKTEEPSKFVNIQDIIANNSIDTNDVNENNDLVQYPIKVTVAYDSIENPLENSQLSLLSDEGSTLLLDGSKDDWGKETESKDKEAKFLCPFCSKEFQKKSRYDYHLSWNHFQDEISDKFPGLECAVCTKKFVKKSNYVSHLGSFHKLIDSLMTVAFNDKMAAIREAEQSKSFASPKHEGGDGVWMETPKIKIVSTPNNRRKTSSCKEPEDSGEMANAATPARTIKENRQ